MAMTRALLMEGRRVETILHKVRPGLEPAKGIINGLIIVAFLLLIFLVLSGFRCHLNQVVWRGNVHYGEGTVHDNASWTPYTIDHDKVNWNVHGGIELRYKVIKSQPKKGKK